MNNEKKLYRTDYNKMISGVCNGISEYFNFDVTLVRILFAILGISSFGTVIMIYIILAIIMPVKKY